MRGKAFWILLVEGWLYTALAVADVVARIYRDPAGRVTRIVSLVIGEFYNQRNLYHLNNAQGGFTTLSLLLYTMFFIILLIRPNPSYRGPLISNLPKRLQTIARALLIVIIPFLLTFNTISNFFGVSFFGRSRRVPHFQLLQHTHIYCVFDSCATFPLFSLIISSPCIPVLARSHPRLPHNLVPRENSPDVRSPLPCAWHQTCIYRCDSWICPHGFPRRLISPFAAIWWKDSIGMGRN